MARSIGELRDDVIAQAFAVRGSLPDCGDPACDAPICRLARAVDALEAGARAWPAEPQPMEQAA